MPQNLPIQLTFAGLPGGDEYCFTNPNRFALDILANVLSYVPGNYSIFNYGNPEPSAENRDKPWIRTDEFNVFDKLYTFSGGKWISPNSEPASSPVRRWVEMTETDVWSYDGGDGSNPSTTSPTDSNGAMWQVDHNYDFRFPLGAGTSPAPASTVVSVGDVGGQEKSVLTAANLPLHKHAIGIEGDGTAADAENGRLRVGAGTEVDWQAAESTSMVGFTRDSGGQATPDNFLNMPPYRVGFWIRRTARKFFVPV